MTFARSPSHSSQIHREVIDEKSEYLEVCCIEPMSIAKEGKCLGRYGI